MVTNDSGLSSNSAPGGRGREHPRATARYGSITAPAEAGYIASYATEPASGSRESHVSRETQLPGDVGGWSLAGLVSSGDAQLGASDAVRDYFGAAYPVVARFAELLQEQGELRGLIGPDESKRIWNRHILNCAVVREFSPESGRVADLGSGAGLPGIVLAAMQPRLGVTLIEPMERRTDWLTWVADELGLDNVTVLRARADEIRSVDACFQAVTARAVAPLGKLGRWTKPLLARHGSLVALKGRNVRNEIEKAQPELRKLGFADPVVRSVRAVVGADETTVAVLPRR